MESSNDKLSAKQIEDLLRISKVQLHYWGHLIDLKPLERSPRRGLAHVYSRDNLFCLALLQRLFQEFGFSLPAAVAMVQRLLREVGLERLQRLPSVTVTSPASREPQRLQPKRRLGRTTLHRPHRAKRRSAIAGSIMIPLKDLQEVANGPVN